MNSLSRQNISVFARYLYEIEGRPQGQAKEHWLRAERQLSENLFQIDRSVHVGHVEVKFGKTRVAEYMELGHCHG
jgi:hypothetical protein